MMKAVLGQDKLATQIFFLIFLLFSIFFCRVASLYLFRYLVISCGQSLIKGWSIRNSLPYDQLNSSEVLMYFTLHPNFVIKYQMC